MKKILILLPLALLFRVTESQPSKKVLNNYFLKYSSGVVSFPDLFIEPKLFGPIDSVEIIINDTTSFRVDFKKNKIASVKSDRSKINFGYKLGRIANVQLESNDSIFSRFRITHLFPFILISNNGIQTVIYKGFGEINKMTNLSGFKTMSKTKMRYCFGKIKKIKNYGWNTVGQKCHYSGYSKFQYLTDTTINENYFVKNDSIALQTKYTFDSKGNILSINKLIKQRVIGWGIDATFYAYNGNKVESTKFDYVFDNNHNWLQKREFLNGILQNKTIRKIFYTK
jgi:hypothetical protein